MIRYIQIPIFLIIASLVVLSGCSGGETTQAQTADGRSNIRIIVVTHGQAADPNWSVFQNGVDRAARDMGVTVEYQAPESFDMVAMSRLIDAAVASNPDGLIVTIPDVDALEESIRSAIEAGIPVISVNSGGHVAQELGVLMHVGQAEYEAGYEGGKRLAAAGLQEVLCVNMEVGNVSLDLRCQGVHDAMEEAGATSRVLAVELANPTETQQRIQAALTADPGIDGLITLGPTAAIPAMEALQEHEGDDVTLATFDLSPEVLEAIKDGRMLFAIDQQFYLQGYLPVVMLTLHIANMNTVANGVIKTGPRFVTRENVSRLQELAAANMK